MTSITQAAADADDPDEWVLLTWDGSGHLTVYSDAHAGRDLSCQLAEAQAVLRLASGAPEALQ